MPQVKQNSTPKVKVRLLSAIDGIQGISGLTSANCSLAISRSDGTTNSFSSGTFTLTEITSGSFVNTGYYWLDFPAYGSAVLGAVIYCVTVNTGSARAFLGTVDVVADLASDILGTLGTPASASLSADIAAVKLELDTVNTTTSSTSTTVSNINTKLGSPAGASVSADIASVSTAVGTVSTNVSAVNTKLGTPAGASVSVDIAAVKSELDTVNTTTAGTSSTVTAVSTNVSAIDTKLGTPVHGSVSLDIANIASSIDLTPVLDAVAAVQSTVDDLHQVEFGKWKVFTTGLDANRLVLYDVDGTTVLKKFDLKDDAGAATTGPNIFERDPV